MNRSLRGIIFLVIIGVVVVVLVRTFHVKPSKPEVMEQLINDISLEKMQKDIAQQVSVHKKYISQLKGLNSQIKALGIKIENKVDVAKGFGEIGDEYVKNQFLPLALANYTMGLEIFPQDPVLNYKRGMILANLGTYDPKKRQELFEEAQKLYKKSLELDANYVDPHYSLALLYLVSHEDGVAVGSLPEALSEIQNYLDQARGSNIQGYFLKARIAYSQGDDNLAMQSYQTILNLVPVGSASYKQAKDNIAQLGMR